MMQLSCYLVYNIKKDGILSQISSVIMETLILKEDQSWQAYRSPTLASALGKRTYSEAKKNATPGNVLYVTTPGNVQDDSRFLAGNRLFNREEVSWV